MKRRGGGGDTQQIPMKKCDSIRNKMPIFNMAATDTHFLINIHGYL
jgi:hypothetical protein